MFKKWSQITALLLCIAVPGASARNLFVTSPDGTGSNLIGAFTGEPLLFAANIPGPAGATQVIAGPAGKHYVLGRTAADGVSIFQGTFPALQLARRIALPEAPNALALSPDARRLVVVYPNGIQIYDTATDTLLTNSSRLNVGANPRSVAISADSSRAYVVIPEQLKVVAINLESANIVAEGTVNGTPTSVSVGPNAALYVTARSAIYEYDPQSLQVRATMNVNGQPGPLVFSPSGRYALSVNELSITGQSAYLVDLARRTAADIPSVGVPLTEVAVADDSTAYAYSSQTGRVYSINLVSRAAPTLFNALGVVLEQVRDIALSNEAPQARSLFVLTNNGLFKIDLAQGTAVGPVAASGVALSFTGPAATGEVVSLLQINNTQSLAPGSTSLPLIVRAVNGAGLPVANAPIAFRTESTDIQIVNASSTTDQQGFAQATVNVPSFFTTGAVTVLATTTAGVGQEATFTLNVATGNPGTGNPGTGTPGSTTISVVTGQGQIVSEGYPPAAPLAVIVRDAAGRPLPNVPITWQITQGSGGLGSVSDSTNENGIASASFSNFLVQPGQPFSTSVVTASTGTETVNFFVTTVPRLPNGGRGEAIYTLRAPVDRFLSLQAGETRANAIQVVVGALSGAPINNVGIRIGTDDPNVTASCRGGVPLSDNSGLVTCDLVAGQRIGETQARIIVGENALFPFTLRIERGTAANVRISGGNNQTGTLGQQLTLPLVVEVTDLGQNPVPNAEVIWEIVTPGSATVTSPTTRTDENGRATTRVTLGQQSGAVQIRARSGSGSATFSFVANLAATRLDLVSGGGQSAVVSQAFAQPIQVRLLDAQNRPVTNATVSFAVTSGAATVPASAITDATGTASVNVTAGAAAGPVTVQASAGGLTQTINLTVLTAGPNFNANSFLNAAGYTPGISPGSIAVINAAGIATGITGSVTPGTIVGALPTTLAGVEVLFNGVRAPIFAVSNVNNQESVIVQVPFEVAPGNTSVTIRTASGGTRTVDNVQIQAIKPGLFDFVDSNGRRYAVALRPDGSYVTSANPARRGETVRVFATGLGQTNPATGTNRAGGRDQNVATTVIAGINNAGVRLLSAKLQENAVGVYVVEMEIPQNTPQGDIPVALAIIGANGEPVFAGSAIPIQ
jgi:uncharacterized protein (TIGR03437 family)